MRVAGGASSPTRSPAACAGRASSASTPVRASAATPRSTSRRPDRIAAPFFMSGNTPADTSGCPDLECITQSDSPRPMWEQLVAIEIAVDRHLHQTVCVEGMFELHGQAGAYISDRTHGVGRVGQSTLIGALAQNVEPPLRYPLRISFIPKPDAKGRRIARAKIIAGLILLVGNR